VGEEWPRRGRVAGVPARNVVYISYPSEYAPPRGEGLHARQELGPHEESRCDRDITLDWAREGDGRSPS
jgi:hypothetical protein